MLLPSIDELLRAKHIDPIPQFSVISPTPSLNIFAKAKQNQNINPFKNIENSLANAQHNMQSRKIEKKKATCVYTTFFSKEEDIKLMKLIDFLGKDNWILIAQAMGTKSPRQCKDRWHNYLNPKGATNSWTIEEDTLLTKLYSTYGPKWKKIAQLIPGRSINSIRNRWKLLLKQSKKHSTGECVTFF